jgi:hypothetical protein
MGFPLEIVILDDMSRFAGHVWQYLSRSIEFGIGRMADDGKGDQSEERQLTFKELKPLSTPSGEARIRWINAGSRSWRRNLLDTLRELSNRPVCYFIDVRGPISAGRTRYDWREAVRIVRGKTQAGAEILLVSSYLTGTRLLESQEEKEEFVIQPKTWRTLEKIAQSMRVPPKRIEGLHILVSGAGFELAEDLGGGHGLGMPPTYEILKKGWIGCGYGDKFDEIGYPIPQRLVKDWLDSDLSALRKAAMIPDLDAYWNEALKLVLESARRKSKKTEPRDQKIAASEEEYRVREAFRQAFLNYDWGYLSQSLDAAALGWMSWISTNYTGFADRALALEERYNRSDNPWSIVSTSNEAIQLIRNILHERKQEPVLFKLHGHVEHLLTMAVAGQDKELYSTLSLPVDSLHQVYTAAELYLKRRLGVMGYPSKGSPVVWHIVGHGLKDALLVDVMKRVCRDSANYDYKFLFVRPGVPKNGDPDRRLFDNLGLPADNFIGISLRANQYLARLRRLGLSTIDCADLGTWRESLGVE